MPVSFPKQDYDAWCANSMLRSKKNATLFLKKVKCCGVSVALMPPEFLPASVNIMTIFAAHIAFQKSDNGVMMQYIDEISTVLNY